MKIISGSAHPQLANDIAKELNTSLVPVTLKRFADGEMFVQIMEKVRGEDVFVIQPTSSPANDNLMELLIMLDALKRASAGRITAVLPYFGYARQDRKTSPRTPISAKLVADLLTAAGAQRILTFDLHSLPIVGFFDIPVDHLRAQPVLSPAIPQGTVIVSPDVGGLGRARQYAEKLGSQLAIIDKRRSAPNESEVMNVIGDVSGKACMLIDDMVDTGGTLIKAAEALLNQGAKSVSALATHGVLSGQALDRIQKSSLENLVITDTIAPTDSVKAASKIKRVTVAPLLAQAIAKIADNESVSTLFA